MEVLQVGTMPCGTKIQIECWGKSYDHSTPASTIASYPVAQENMDGRYTPKRNKTFRLSFDFESEKKARGAFRDLIRGHKKLTDYHEWSRNPELIDLL